MNKTNRVYEFNGMEMTKDLLRGWMLKTHPAHIYRKLEDVEPGIIMKAMVMSPNAITYNALTKYFAEFLNYKYKVSELAILNGKVFVLSPKGWFYLTTNYTQDVILTPLKDLARDEYARLAQSKVLPESLLKQLHADTSYQDKLDVIENAWFKVFYSESEQCWYISPKGSGAESKLSNTLTQSPSIGETILPYLDFDNHKSLLNELIPFLGSVTTMELKRYSVAEIKLPIPNLTVFKDSQGGYFSLFESDHSFSWLELPNWPKKYLELIGGLDHTHLCDDEIVNIIRSANTVLGFQTNHISTTQKETTMEQTNVIETSSGVISKEFDNGKEVWFLTLQDNQGADKQKILVHLLSPTMLNSLLSQVKLDSKLADEFALFAQDCIRRATSAFGHPAAPAFGPRNVSPGFASQGMSNPKFNNNLQYGAMQSNVTYPGPSFVNPTYGNLTNTMMAGQAFDSKAEYKTLLMTQMFETVPVNTVFNMGYYSVARLEEGWELKTSGGVIIRKDFRDIVDLIVSKFW